MHPFSSFSALGERWSAKCRRFRALDAACIALLGFFLLTPPLAAQPPGPVTLGDVPAPLAPWVPWVLAGHPELPCPLLAETRLCAWPGRLVLDLDDEGGRFELAVEVDRDLDLPLPGDAARWPQAVRDGGTDALLRNAHDQPTVALGAGRHQLSGRFAWQRLPESLPVPPAVGLVDLTLRGRSVLYPRREADGLLWLEGTRSEAAEEDRLTLEVQRRIDDGVPIWLTVRIGLRVAGRAREIDLGPPLPPGFELTRLAGDLPLRLAEGGDLIVQLRPGTWTITLEARSSGPLESLTLRERPAPWPDEEFWIFRSDLAVRAVRLGGAAAVDPQRTTLPADWRSLPAFRLTQGDTLDFTTLRRGEDEPPPDALTLHRTLWLAQSGERLTVQDHLTGTLNRGGRLEVTGRATLGRAAFDEAAVRDRVITLGPESGQAGIEVRQGALAVTADLAYPRGGRLPAVGWNRDVQALHATLELPPGWTLLAAPGADSAGSAWVDRWTLLDFFLLLIIALATWRLTSWRWGVLALLVLGAAWHEAHGTGLWCWWLLLLPLVALGRVLPAGGRAARLVSGLRLLVTVFLAVQLVVFAFDQLKSGLFPQLAGSRHDGPFLFQSMAPAAPAQAAAPEEQAEADALHAERLSSSLPRLEIPKPRRKEGYEGKLAARAQQVDPEAVAQTGPGVPRWRWRRYELGWQGPVGADHHLRLFLLSPAFELLLSLLRIAGVGLLTWRFLAPHRLRAWRAGRGTAAAASFLLVLLASPPARAQEPASPEEPPAPSSDLLAELERRLTAPPPCHPECIEVPRLELEAAGTELRMTAEVHAAADTAWHLPGPTAAWTPEEVRLDGDEAIALRRNETGFLMLRLTPGAHRVTLRGPARDSLTLQLPDRPRVLRWQGSGWTLDGYRPDAPPPSALRLNRQLAADETAGTETVELQPLLILERDLDIGIPWLVHSTLSRSGPTDTAIAVRVPLLTGESVTTPGIAVENGQALLTLERGETLRRFESTLEETPTLTLTAAENRPWLERWQLTCSTVWSCRAEGLPPTRHMAEGQWRPWWQPWPGETLTLHFVRPQTAPGETATFDQVTLVVKPGRRLLEATLDLELRSSRGGEHVLQVPPSARLQQLQVDDRSQPVQGEEGRLAFTVEPGSHRVKAVWQQPHASRPLERVPAVGIDTPAANVDIRIEVPPNRWLLWAGGPRWGPVVTLWLYVLLLLLVARPLGRLAPTPLHTRDWFLLGAGMTQIPLPAAVLVVLWLLVLGYRHRLRPKQWWSYSFLQLVLLGATFIALCILYAAVHTGLLVQPDMQVAGAGSWGSRLQWYADQVKDALPRPYVVWLPLWVWRVLMLLWALWLASRLLRWLPWAWERFTAAGPILAGPKSFPAGSSPPPAAPAPPADPEAPPEEPRAES